VHVDGAATRSCITTVDSIGESAITTIEAIGQTPQGAALQKAWHHGVSLHQSDVLPAWEHSVSMCSEPRRHLSLCDLSAGQPNRRERERAREHLAQPEAKRRRPTVSCSVPSPRPRRRALPFPTARCRNNRPIAKPMVLEYHQSARRPSEGSFPMVKLYGFSKHSRDQ
jgi:hypothetical protein